MSNIDYYNTNAENYAKSSEKLDMQFLRDKFISKGVSHKILDAGFGSGRDTLDFIKKGFNVTSIDGSIELVKRFKRISNNEIECKTFKEIKDVEVFDGVWCCAALLHVKPDEFVECFNNLVRSLKQFGVFYFSIKKLENDFMNDGDRTFYHPSYEVIEKCIKDQNLELLEFFEIEKVGDPNQTFENYFLRKK